MKFKIEGKNNKIDIPENDFKNKEIQLQSKKDNLEILKQQQQKKLDSISSMETQLKQMEENIETQKKVNRIFFRNSSIFIIAVFAIITLAGISYKIYLTNNNNVKIAEYTAIVTEKEKEYQNFIDSTKK